MKAIKNEKERQHFAECIKRDSAAVVEFAAFLENEIKENRHWDEISAAEKLETYRKADPLYRGPSFETISGYGPNSAVIHYRASSETNRTVSTDNVYLLDSGGQYPDGTTDITRTFHYGEPSDVVKEAYTRVLMGHIDLAKAVWTEGLYGRELDVLARLPLYRNGWDYNHGTGHGIGYYLGVHEGPGRINKGYNSLHEPLYVGMFFSDEPGYYEDNNFGIRIENLVTVVEADTPNKFGTLKYLTFQTLTLVPYEPAMIKYDLLTESQLQWLKEYNDRCVSEIGRILLERQNQGAYDWLLAKTALNTLNNVATICPSFQYLQ
jgi:Xaa-Pro aminopeptidase